MTATIALPGTSAANSNSSYRMDVDSAQPWSNLPALHSTRLKTSEMQFGVLETEGVQSLVLKQNGDTIGRVSHASLKELSERVVFPTDFVTGLPIELQARVLNDRMSKVREMPFTLIGENIMPEGAIDPGDTNFLPMLTHASPGSRGILNPAYAAQTAYNIMEAVYGDGVSIKQYSFANGALDLRIKSDYVADVSRKRALEDVVSFGIQLHYTPGIAIDIALYVERLKCLNGMTGFGQEFNWKARTLAGEQHQIDFIKIGIAEALGNFDTVTDHLGDMSEQIVPGDPRQALMQRARAMGITRNHLPALLSAWDEEPDPSEFGMLNAVTRFATHNTEIPVSLSRRLQATAGQWASEFDVVNCRMPRQLAIRAGAQIVEAK